MRLILNAEGVVTQWSQHGNPDPEPGCTALDLSEEQAAEFMDAIAVPHGGIAYVNGAIVVRPAPPSALHQWVDGAWHIDPKLAVNAPIDQKIVEQEIAHKITDRGMREGFLAEAAICDLFTARIQVLNSNLTAIENVLRTLPGNSGFTLTRLDPMPDLKKNKGMQDLQALDDAIRVLRAQRIP